ncbi:shufflon system plasmid conjugative transfer pilus tip adhesin PilV [Gluconacetobacter sp. Hr-1-5]|uniref:shufflon system plasmid conjugative transfer pilus tip adhesin PilV n=1 Tax=Gluconacetobacter sp. Hr-1-5 TaxID=3395370 RepID=UPI003B52A0D5
MSSLIGVMFATLVALTILPRYFGMIENGTTQAVNATTAGQFQALLKAAQLYIDKHGTDLVSTVPVGGTSPLDISALIADSDLPSGFTTVNPYRQNWQVYVRQPASKALDAIVESSDGITLTGQSAVAIASLTGAQGGFVPEDGMFGSMNSSNAYGASGSWQLPLAGLPNPGPGHLYGILVGANTSSETTDYLYRDSVPGHPELNTMRASLDMGGNDINDANNVNATRGVFNAGNPNGGYGGVKVGSAYLYGDDNDAAVRTPGTVYMQHYDGTPANIGADTGYFTRNIGVNGLDPYGGLPAGWGGGLHANDGYFEGTIATGTGGNQSNIITNNGYVKVGDHVDIQDHASVINSGCGLWVSGACFYGDTTNAAVETPGSVSMQHYDGTNADLQADHATFTSVRLGTDGGNAWPGNSCEPNGTIAAKADGSGRLLSCLNGTWQIPPAQISTYVPTTTLRYTGYNRPNPVTGGYSCPPGTTDMNIEQLWYGDYGFSSLHLCSAE